MCVIVFYFSHVYTDRDEQPVRIKLSPVNDEVPEFKNLPRPFLATVPPNAGPGHFVYQLMADDADRGSEVRYILESGKCQGHHVLF